MRRYLTGSWFALSADDAVAMVPASVGEDALAEVGASLSAGSIGAFIEALARATGTSVTSLPDFGVMVRQGDGTRVAVRGHVSARDEATDAEPLSGLGVTGWTEAMWPANADAALTTAVAAESGARSLWFSTGIVLASTVWIADDAAPRSVAAKAVTATSHVPVVAVQAPVVEPVAEPTVSVEAPVTQPPVEPVSAEPAPEESAASGETLAAPLDEADEALLAGADDDSDIGIWGSTIASLPTASPVIQAAAKAPEPPAAPPPVIEPVATTPADVEPVQAPPAPPPPAPLSAPLSAISPPPPPLAQTFEPPTAGAGDHDGATISVAALRNLQSHSATPTFASVEDLARERRGRAVISTGAVVNLDRNVIVGRTPKATRITGDMPHLVAVPSPHQDISRNHLEIRVTDTVVVAIDLDTTNGSVLRRPGVEPMRLHPGELTVVVSQDVIDLGDGITITFEDLP